jgi:hypothetical protein
MREEPGKEERRIESRRDLQARFYSINTALAGAQNQLPRVGRFFMCGPLSRVNVISARTPSGHIHYAAYHIFVR